MAAKGNLNKFILHVLFAFVFMFFSNEGWSQGSKTVYRGHDVWFLQLTRANINDHWFVSNEFHERRHDWLKEQEQFIFRPAINYNLNKYVILTTGYSYVLTSPYGIYKDVPINIPEHNIWQETTIRHTLGKELNILHRLRLQERWIGVPEFKNNEWAIGDTRYASRFRYRLTGRFDIKKLNDSKAIYAHIFDEIWFHFNPSINQESLDRNWFYSAVGYRFSNNLQIEVAFLDQYIVRKSFVEINTGLQFTVVCDL